MTVASLTEVLAEGMRDGYAIAGLVVLGWEDARAYVEAADEVAVPIVLQAGPGCRRYTPVEVLGPMFRHLAGQARMPVACHIDHAYSVEECQRGLDCGFTSVMIDGSKLELSANIALTAEVVARARRYGASVEGEVGLVGYEGGAASAGTAPEEAARFDRESGVDALAISVGNVHLQQEKAALIDIGALRALELATRSPLVLHGGSGIPGAVRRMLGRDSRVKKFNIGTELRQAFGAALRKSLAGKPDAFDRIELLGDTISPVRAATTKILRELRGRE
jgi:fructose-bisphosphate aldolase class II